MQGIYKIINTETLDFYIGSSLNINQRFSNHRTKLKTGKHRNQRLLRAWKKYGEDSFLFSVVYLTSCLSHENLRLVEQLYLNKLKPQYNLSKRADCPYLGKKHFEKMHKASAKACSMEWIVTNPTGEEFKITSLSNFCKHNGLKLGSLHRVAQGKKSHHRGWKARYAHESEQKFVSNRGKQYMVQNLLDGTVNKIQNLSKFLKTKNISKTTFYRSMKKRKPVNNLLVTKFS